jgi:hypothetical protein
MPADGSGRPGLVACCDSKGALAGLGGIPAAAAAVVAAASSAAAVCADDTSMDDVTRRLLAPAPAGLWWLLVAALLGCTCGVLPADPLLALRALGEQQMSSPPDIWSAAVSSVRCVLL